MNNSKFFRSHASKTCEFCGRVSLSKVSKFGSHIRRQSSVSNFGFTTCTSTIGREEAASAIRPTDARRYYSQGPSNSSNPFRSTVSSHASHASSSAVHIQHKENSDGRNIDRCRSADKRRVYSDDANRHTHVREQFERTRGGCGITHVNELIELTKRLLQNQHIKDTVSGKHDGATNDFSNDAVDEWLSEAVSLVDSWNRYIPSSLDQSMDRHNQRHPRTDGSISVRPDQIPGIDVICAFQILDQISQLLISLQRQASGSTLSDLLSIHNFMVEPSSDASYLISLDMLNKIVWKWQQEWIRKSSGRHNSTTHQIHQGQQEQEQRNLKSTFSSADSLPLSLWTPSQLVERIDKYQHCSLLQRPDAKIYNLIIDTATLFPPHDMNEGVFFAESLVHRMLEVTTNQASTFCTAPHLVDGITVGTLMKSWLKSKSPEAPYKIEKWLARLQSLWQQNHRTANGKGVLDSAVHIAIDNSVRSPSFHPNRIHYSMAIQAWANAANPKKAQALLEELFGLFYKHRRGNNWELVDACCPDTMVFNSILSAWSKTTDPKLQREAPKRAEGLLKKMKELQRTILRDRPNLVQVDDDRMPVEAFAAPNNSDYVSCEPDEYTFSAVLSCWTQSGLPHAADQAESLLEEMETSWAAGYTQVRPNIFAYNVVLAAHGKRGNSEQAQRLFEKLLDLKSRYDHEIDDASELDKTRNYSGEDHDEIFPQPDTTTFNCLLHAWANSGKPEAPDQATHILNQMVEYAQDFRDLHPDQFTLSSVLMCWCKATMTSRQTDSGVRGADIENKLEPSFAADQAENVLLTMESRYGVRPNIVCYNSVIQAWCNVSRSREVSREESHRAVCRVLSLLNHIFEQENRREEEASSEDSIRRSDRSAASFRQQNSYALSQRSSSSTTLRPNDLTLRWVLESIAGGAIENKYERGTQIVSLMRANGIQPSEQQEKLLLRLKKQKKKT